MTYILQINASARGVASHSRLLGDEIVKNLLICHPELTVRERDLYEEPVPHISNKTIEGFYTQAEQMSAELSAATFLSDELIKELKGAQFLVIAAPMYNFSVPSSLKAWIDQIVRIDATFSYDGTSFQGLLPLKRAYLALAYGAKGYALGGDFSSMNYLEPYLQSLLGFLGIARTEVFRIEGTTGDPELVERARSTLYQNVHKSITEGH